MKVVDPCRKQTQTQTEQKALIPAACLKHSHSPCHIFSPGTIPRKQPSSISLSFPRLILFSAVCHICCRSDHPVNYRTSRPVATPADPTLTSQLRPDSTTRLCCCLRHLPASVSTLQCSHRDWVSAGCVLMKKPAGREQAVPDWSEFLSSFIQSKKKSATKLQEIHWKYSGVCPKF